MFSVHLGGNRRWVSLLCIFGCETTVVLIKISHIACSSLSRKIRFSKSSYFLKTKMKLRRRNIIPFFFIFSFWNGENNTPARYWLSNIAKLSTAKLNTNTARTNFLLRNRIADEARAIKKYSICFIPNFFALSFGNSCFYYIFAKAEEQPFRYMYLQTWYANRM